MLKFGQRSDEVQALQARLNALPGQLPVADLPTTGYYGYQTQAAVRALQELAASAGLKDAQGKSIRIDGIAGPQVDFLLKDAQIQKLLPFAKAAEAADALTAPKEPAAVTAPQPSPETEVKGAAALQPSGRGKGKAAVAFTDPCGIDVAHLSPEVKAQANSKGWVMALRPEEEGRSVKGGNKYTGGLYFINVKTGEVKSYAALGGGYKNSDLQTDGPTPGSQTDLYKGDADNSINAIYTGLSVHERYTSQKGIRYGTVVRLDGDPLEHRNGFLIHKAFGGATHGCVGVNGPQAIASVADAVKEYDIRKMVVLGPNAVRLPEPPAMTPPPEPLPRMTVAQAPVEGLSHLAADAMRVGAALVSKVRGA